MVNTNAPSVSWREAWPKPLGMLSRDEHGFFVTYGVVTTLPQNHVAQFIGDCSSSKWSKHVTNFPFLALLAMDGSKAAYKIISACSNAVS